MSSLQSFRDPSASGRCPMSAADVGALSPDDRRNPPIRRRRSVHRTRLKFEGCSRPSEVCGREDPGEVRPNPPPLHGGLEHRRPEGVRAAPEKDVLAGAGGFQPVRQPSGPPGSTEIHCRGAQSLPEAQDRRVHPGITPSVCAVELVDHVRGGPSRSPRHRLLRVRWKREGPSGGLVFAGWKPIVVRKAAAYLSSMTVGPRHDSACEADPFLRGNRGQN